MILIISDDSRGDWGQALAQALGQKGQEVTHLVANRLEIKPCAACNSCTGKTFGSCVIQDDMQEVLTKMRTCQDLVWVSPVVFGGVSYHVKKVMDRMSPVGDPRYFVSKGELVKGRTGQRGAYIMVGYGNKLTDAECQGFLSFHQENLIIMNAEGKAYILDERASEQTLDQIAKEVARG